MTFPLAEFILKSLVSCPDEVQLEVLEVAGRRALHVKVNQRDIAKVMGSRGLVIRAIRTVLCTLPRDFDDVVVDTEEGAAQP